MFAAVDVDGYGREVLYEKEKILHCSLSSVREEFARLLIGKTVAFVSHTPVSRTNGFRNEPYGKKDIYIRKGTMYMLTSVISLYKVSSK